MNKDRHENRKLNPDDRNRDERKSPGASDRDRMQDTRKNGDQDRKHENPPKH